MLQSQQIKELRKSGQLDESFKLALRDLEENPENLYAKKNISWVYNDLLKREVESENAVGFLQIMEKIQKLQLPETEAMLYDNIAWKIGQLLFKLARKQQIPFEEVFKIVDIAKTFHYTKPSEGYSFLLKAVHKILKPNREKYLAFIDWWNTENLRPEDYEKDVLPNGNQVMSVAEQVFTAYFKSLVPSAENPITREKVLENVSRIDEIYEKNHSFVYLIYFKVQMLLAIGENKHLLSSFLPFAQKKSREFWVWDLLYDIVETDEEKLTCLCMACLSGIKVEQMKTNIYLKMAEYFVSKRMFPEAKNEIIKIQKIKAENSQKIPNKVVNLANSEWFQNCEATERNVPFYRQHSKNADSILFSDIPSENIFIYNVNAEKKMVNFIRENNNIGFFKHERINPNLHIKVGDILNVRFSQISQEAPSRILTLRKEQDENLLSKNSKSLTGTVKLNEKGFAFLGDVYISPMSVQKFNLKNGQEITGHFIRKYNRKKEKLTWELKEKVLNLGID